MKVKKTEQTPAVWVNRCTFCISGLVPDDMKNIVDLFNTWVSFFYREYFSGIAMRYSGNWRSGAYIRDIERVTEELLKYCRSEKSPTIGMITFSQRKIKRFNLSQYPTSYTVIFEKGFPEFPEYTFYDLAKCLKLELAIHEYSKIGVDFNIN